MGTSRFVLSSNNLLEAAALMNGTGGGAPARNETVPYVMERAKGRDRCTVWKAPAAGESDWDLGAALTVVGFSLHGIRSTGATSVQLQSSPSYPPGVWTNRGAAVTLNAVGRDTGQIIAGTSARYWRFHATGGTSFSIGRLVLFATYTDLGIMHSPGAESSPFLNRLEQANVDGTLMLNNLGDPGRDFVLPFLKMTTGNRTILEALAAQAGSVIYIDPDDVFYEVVLKGGRVKSQRAWSNLFDIQIEMTRLP